MKSAVSFVVLLPLLSGHPGQGTDPAGKDKARLEGTWVIVSASWCGKPLPLPTKDEKTKSIVWSFTGERYKSFIGGPEEAYEEGTYRIDPGKAPKHLELMPTKGELLTTRKCLYALQGDELKIAFTVWFSPGTPEHEIAEGKKMRATRPKSLVPHREDLTVILTLKRQKKQEPRKK
jgi:uncharacterized protein (TIGR03067 family)